MAITRSASNIPDYDPTTGDTIKTAVEKNDNAIDEVISQANTDISASLQAANNLSDVADADTSLTNLGGTATGTAVFKAADAATARTAIGAGTGSGDLVSTNNLSDLANAATSRQNLGVEIGVDVQAYNASLIDKKVAYWLS